MDGCNKGTARWRLKYLYQMIDLTQDVPVHQEQSLSMEVDQLLVDALPLILRVANDCHVGPQINQGPYSRCLPIHPERVELLNLVAKGFDESLLCQSCFRRTRVLLGGGEGLNLLFRELVEQE